jgi:thiosulfate dehydrogenase
MKTKHFLLFLAVIFAVIMFSCNNTNNTSGVVITMQRDTIWHAPDSLLLSKEPNADLIRYGRKLIENTSYYLGPKGTVAQLSCGLNCQNCHLEAGTKPYGNNYALVASTYPRFRARSGTVETIYKRLSDCFNRSLNGKAPDSTSKEMQAMAAYIVWIGKDVATGKTPVGAGAIELKYLDQAADTVKGKEVYLQECKVCHGDNGAGLLNATGIGYQYPPLWGKNSYNTGAGMYRITRLAAFVKANMPQGATYTNPSLTDEQAWDVAAFINSQTRPVFDAGKDWPDISTKPVDYPFGPYADDFTEAQHKYGPFKSIADARKQANKKKV